jgi:asparagine synthase (glutamine-hydrolysing)
MCGIFGIVGDAPLEAQLRRSLATLSHRGPDGSGIFVSPGVGLGHRRLSIIDLEGGTQPMFNEDRTKCVVFNGEIYNFPELRNELRAKGHRFTTRSDTETILHAYEEWGEACVERMAGMFAFAIWDEREKALFLARDRLGIKPLFVADYGGRFYFASEIKAILADPAFPRDMDYTGVACYFSLSYIPAPLTVFRRIRKLLPGHTLTLRDGRARTRKYWDIHYIPNRDRSEASTIEELMALLGHAVQSHLISDVPIGAFLSGGVDSSTGVALMSRFSTQPVNTFCIGFGGSTGSYLDERGYARMVAERYRTNHREHEVEPAVASLIDTMVRAFDEPFADDSAIPSYFVCGVARQDVTVALSGLGGDEAFAGYERYLGMKLRRAYRKIPAFLRENMIRQAVEALSEAPGGHYTVNHMKRFVRSASLQPDQSYYGCLSILNDRIEGAFFSDPAAFRPHLQACRDMISGYFNSDCVSGAEDSLDRAFYCDIKTYLPEDILAVTDRMSMHHALEVRVPFLDHKFLEFCATVPPELKIKGLAKKHLLKKAVAPLLPKEVLYHRKQGFVGPMTMWLKNDLKSYTLEALSKENLDKHGIINYRTIRQVMDEHFSGREIHDTLIWAALMFQKWFDLYIEQALPGNTAREEAEGRLAVA